MRSGSITALYLLNSFLLPGIGSIHYNEFSIRSLVPYFDVVDLVKTYVYTCVCLVVLLARKELSSSFDNPRCYLCLLYTSDAADE